MKFLIVLFIALALAHSALGFSRFFRRLTRPNDNPVEEGYLGHDFYNAVVDLKDAKLFKNFVVAYSKYFYNFESDLEKITSGQVKIDTSKMTDEQIDLVNEELQKFIKATQKLNALWRDNIDNKVSKLDSIADLPGLVLPGMRSLGPDIAKPMIKLIKNRVKPYELLPNVFRSYTQELPVAIFKDLARHPIKIASLIARQLTKSRN